MIYISHRGNLNGPNTQKENHPDYIKKAWMQGFDVEVDVWYVDNQFCLGHDEPQYEVDWKFLSNPSFWCHAKNIEALSIMLNCNAHCFFHNTDDATLTSKGIIWTYPGKFLTNKSICVMPENKSFKVDWKKAYGVCSDYIQELRNER